MGFKETVMGLAGKVSDTVDKGIEAGKDGYQKMSEKNRLNKEINQLNAEINDIFMTVGRKVYTDNPDSPEFKVVFESVKDKEAKLASNKRQLSLLDGNVVCPACNEVIPKDSRICNKCGAIIATTETTTAPEPEFVKADSVKVCINCGEKLADGAKFCGKCGTKVAD
ncbi:MAG: zinc ribbon domain-containing protein [Ruminococcus flavefaciens]|nr:zinc ribbon domain-containing protein [Ruminococcus flavefaciens]MCM1230331.1 zinc ribbon domain-containing protein [Ruminococcus flavefaciens]